MDVIRFICINVLVLTQTISLMPKCENANLPESHNA